MFNNDIHEIHCNYMGWTDRNPKLLRNRIYEGFTLVELLAVVAIIGLLTAMLIPAVQMVREAARRNNCANNARQIALALHSFEGAGGRLPPTMGVINQVDFLIHWQARTLPFLDQLPLSDAIDEQLRAGVHVYFNTHRTTNVPVFQCTSNPELRLIVRPKAHDFRFAYTDYCGVAGVTKDDKRGVFRTDVNPLERREAGLVRFSNVTDGLSNTLMFGERPPADTGEGYGQWLGSQTPLSATIGMFETAATLAAYAADLVGCNTTDLGYQPGVRGGPCGWTHHWSFHPGGANFSRADASIHFVPYATDRETLSALATRDGGESLN